MIKRLGLIFIICALSACQKTTKTQDYFMVHLEDLMSANQRCSLLPGPDAFNDPECVAAINALQQIKALATEAQNDPAKFGLNILQAQMRLSKETPGSAAFAKDQLDIESRLALIQLSQSE